MYYILFYKTIENYIEKRAPFRAEHLALAQQAQSNGHLILAGALDNPTDQAVLVFKTDSFKIVEDFAKSDPYVVNGLIVEWSIRPWNVVIGNDKF